MKDVEDESLVLANDDDASAPRVAFFFFSSSGAIVVLVELESGEEIDFNSREDDKDATMNDAEDEEGMEEGMVNKQKNNGREVEIVMRFRSGNYPSSVSNVNAANDGGIVAIDAEDNMLETRTMVFATTMKQSAHRDRFGRLHLHLLRGEVLTSGEEVQQI